jgi:pimeloyl-ACP methyl ester carboxylesterase
MIALIGASLLRMGSVTLHSCKDARAYYCGSIARPLDPSGEVAGTIRIGFMLLPHSQHDAPARRTIVAMEGGPGYSSTGSRSGYRALFGPLLKTHDLLMVDDRGTGRSGPLLCRALQDAAVMTRANIARCGRRLGDRSDLYGTALVSDDLAAVLDALHIGTVDLYGDSYGTFAVQTFAGRHPRHVHAIVLDGAYPVVGSDPWLASTMPEVRGAFNAVCRRSRSCAKQPGTSMSRIRALLTRLRRPRAAVTPSQLAFVMESAGLDPLAYQQLDAAARAYLHGDRLPLERLVRLTYANEEVEGGPVSAFSQALFVAASCSDNPEPYDMTLPPALREREWQHVLRAKERSDPALDAPFTIPEFLGIPPDYGYVSLCLTWPVASAAHPAREPLLPDPHLPDVPALVLVGDLDTITTPAESAAAARLFPRATFVVVKNNGHVTAVGDIYHCASVLVRRFLATGSPDSAACAQQLPPLRLVAAFERTTSSAFTARDSAIAGARDVLERIRAFGQTSGRGLRGGRFQARMRGHTIVVTLSGIAWTDDVAASGSMVFHVRSCAVALRERIARSAEIVTASWNDCGLPRGAYR